MDIDHINIAELSDDKLPRDAQLFAGEQEAEVRDLLRKRVKASKNVKEAFKGSMPAAVFELEQYGAMCFARIYAVIETWLETLFPAIADSTKTPEQKATWIQERGYLACFICRDVILSKSVLWYGVVNTRNIREKYALKLSLQTRMGTGPNKVLLELEVEATDWPEQVKIVR